MTTIDDLVAIEEIRTLTAVYARGLDRFDITAVMQVFSDDAVFDASPCGMDACVGKPAVEEFFVHNQSVMADQIHLYGNFVIELDGPTSAHGTSSLWQDGHLKDGTRVHSVVFNEDTYVKRDGAWFISRRVCTPLMPLEGNDAYTE
jgi:ketosteroid isomerase-like protein